MSILEKYPPSCLARVRIVNAYKLHGQLGRSVFSPFDKGNAMSMMQEFREFAVKGNVIDLAVGVIIGGAFGKIVTSMVDDIIMPIVGSIFGNLDFTNLYVALGKVPEGTAPTLAALRTAGVPTLAYGNFITVAINFIILAFIIFLMIKQVNRLKRETPAAPPAPVATPEDVVLLREIRDSLKR
jgi:large conductance mechanosensitive channel